MIRSSQYFGLGLAFLLVLGTAGALCPVSAQPSGGAADSDSLFVNTSVLDNGFPIRAFSVSLPAGNQADAFMEFVERDLAPAGINTLVVRVNWDYDFQSHPELANPKGWNRRLAGRLAALCREKGITLVPLINLLGHQSWEGRAGKLLQVYPQFDEKPHVKLPEKYEWPNADRLYCKSYCPNHPDVHAVVFDCVDEVVRDFGAKNFHAGLDEVFDLADINCPRCGGLDPAELFAEEVNRIAAHLAPQGVRLWMWADRLIDGRPDASGYGEWSASLTNTHRAIDRIDRSVMMCDWHYRDAEQSAVYFAIKGFDVITCGWERPDITRLQLDDMLRFRSHSSRHMSSRFKGYMQTVWSGFGQFLEEYRNGSERKPCAADNYRFLKEYLRRYSRQAQPAADSAAESSRPEFGI